MTELDRAAPTEKLDLPSPRSPQELDEHILHYAAQRAPQPERRAASWWLGGLATASITAMALFLAVPGLQPIDTPIEQNNGTTAVSKNNNSMTDSPELSVRTIVTGAESTPASAPLAAAEDLARPGPVADSASFRAASSAVLTEARGVDAADAADQSSANNHPKQETAISYQRIGAAPRREQEQEEIKTQLRKFAQLQAAGEQQRASAAYQQFRQECKACMLPESLTQAMARYQIDLQD